MAAREERVLRIGADGTIGCVYSDDLGLSYLGNMTARRASDIVWSDADQGWMIVLASGQKLPGYWRRRDDAIAAEVDFLNRKVIDGTIEEVFDAS